MTQIEAKDLKIGDRYNTGASIQEVISIVKVSDKAIEFRTGRIHPDVYCPIDENKKICGFFSRKRLSTKLNLLNR